MKIKTWSDPAFVKAYKLKYYLEHRERLRQKAYEWNRAHVSERRIMSRRAAVKRREQNRANARLYYQLNRDRILARKKQNRNPNQALAAVCVFKAVKSGKLTRPDKCSHCLKQCKPDGHHYLGYAPEHWLDVVWLCPSCHRQAHFPLPIP